MLILIYLMLLGTANIHYSFGKRAVLLEFRVNKKCKISDAGNRAKKSIHLKIR